MKNKIPKHIAIIMDGNSRWAVRNNVSKIESYEKGIDVAQNIIKKVQNLGCDYHAIRSNFLQSLLR